MDEYFKVNGQNIRSIGPEKKMTFASGSSNFIKFHFDLSNDWDGLQVSIHFYKDGVDIVQTGLVNLQAYLPSNIDVGNYTFNLIGTDQLNDIVATTSWFDIAIIDNFFKL